MSFLRHRTPWIIGFVVLVIFGVLTWIVFVGSSRNDTWVAIGLAALASLFAAVSAVASLVQAFEAQKQREMNERPYVMLYFDGAYGGFLYLVITNVGNAPAVDVKVKFEPGFQVHTGQSVNDISLFQNPISFFPPGMIYRQLIDASHRFLEKGKPTFFQAHLEYRTILDEKITDSIKYDLEYLRDSHLPAKTTEKSLAEISDHLKNIHGLFKQVKHGNSLLVQTPQEYFRQLKNSIEGASSKENS